MLTTLLIKTIHIQNYKINLEFYILLQKNSPYFYNLEMYKITKKNPNLVLNEKSTYNFNPWIEQYSSN